MYLTPQLFRSLGTGSDLDGLEDNDLGFILSRASTLVDSYCAVPNLPSKHDFRGGSITSEAHVWRVGNDHVAGQHSVHLLHRPIRTVTQFRIYATNTQYLQLEPSEIYINEMAGYIEVASLQVTPFGIFGAAILPIIGLKTPVARVSYTYGWQFGVVGETLARVDADVFRAQAQWWDSTVPAVIYKNGTVDTANFTIDYNEGTATSTTTLAATDVVTADYTSKLPREITNATAIIATAILGERELAAKGMNRLEALEVEEIRLRRTIPQRAGVVESSIPSEAKALLEGFVFRSVR